MKKLIWIGMVALALASGGCAVTVTARGSMFKKDAESAEKVAGLARSTAKALIAAGRAPADVEAIVRATGVDADSARRIVAEVQAELGK